MSDHPRKVGGSRPGELRGNAGKGRVKGVPNKTTATIKEAIEKAFQEVGGAEYLVNLAHTDPKAFTTLLGKIIPSKIEGGLTLRHLFTPDQLRRMADEQERE